MMAHGTLPAMRGVNVQRNGRPHRQRVTEMLSKQLVARAAMVDAPVAAAAQPRTTISSIGHHDHNQSMREGTHEAPLVSQQVSAAGCVVLLSTWRNGGWY
jgi:hypothetical protein